MNQDLVILKIVQEHAPELELYSANGELSFSVRAANDMPTPRRMFFLRPIGTEEFIRRNLPHTRFATEFNSFDTEDELREKVLEAIASYRQYLTNEPLSGSHEAIADATGHP